MTDEEQAQINMALIIAMHVRNRMENFHVKYLSDKQMKELNPIIRNAIYEALQILNIYGYGKPKKYSKLADMYHEYLLRMIPDYWEKPNADNLYKEWNEFIQHKKIKGTVYEKI